MQAGKPEKKFSLPVKVCLSLLALAVLCMHLFVRDNRVDGTAAMLLAIAILPWIADLLETLELPGGWKFHFRNIEEEQIKQGKRLEQLQLAFRLLLTDDELKHLRRFAGTDPMPLKRDWTTPYYERELRRLKAVGLIEGSVGTFMHDGGDARTHLGITAEGRKFLEFRDELDKQAATAVAP